MGKRKEAGMSLVEALVAIFLVGLIALSVAPLMMLANQAAAAAQESTELVAVGAAQMEALRGLGFADPQLAAGGSITASAAGYSMDPYNGDPNQYLRWEIIDDNAARKRIQLVVGNRAAIWGPPREMLIETFRTDIQ